MHLLLREREREEPHKRLLLIFVAPLVMFLVLLIVLFLLHNLDGYYPGHVNCEAKKSDADRFPGVDER